MKNQMNVLKQNINKFGFTKPFLLITHTDLTWKELLVTKPQF